MARQIIISGAIVVGLSQAGTFLSVATATAAERYRATFTTTWTATSHPIDFPASAHWSPPIGAVHNDQVSFWEPGSVATEGIQNMAELGTTSSLASEVDDAIAAGTALAVVRGRSLPTGSGSTSIEFEVTEAFPLVTVTSMVAPSPDWFVGVHGLSLRASDDWIGKLVVDLLPYDAGTDSGASFQSADLETVPRGVVARINQPPLENPLPMGTFTFLRLISFDFNASGDRDAADLDALSAAVRTGSFDGQFDVNGDQRVDAADRTAWITELRRTCVGDSNLDGVFTSSDLIDVLAAGEYEDPIVGNSTWATGDWNGDAEFDTTDLFEAFQIGCYETEGADVAAVPEPHGAAIIAWAGGMLLVCRRRSSRCARVQQ